MLRAVGLAVLVGVAGCDTAAPPTTPEGNDTLAIVLRRVATGLDAPVFLASPPGDTRLFIAERSGRIRVVQGTTLQAGAFLDLSSLVSTGGEQGLLSFAFRPDWETSGFVYVSYTDRNGDTRVARYRRSLNNPDIADPTSGTVVLAQPQPFGNHNGGLIAFGGDGMLYVGLGDGGSAGDPFGAGQDRATLLGKLLRIDVASHPYAIPPDNPFVLDSLARGEIWALGLRNPWRFSFDGPAGLLYVADVGQDRLEEISVVPDHLAGVNFGWNRLEGHECFAVDPCDTAGTVLPVLTYGHDEGCAIVGGYVYRGRLLPELTGHFFYADNCEGWIRSMRVAADTAADRREWDAGTAGEATSFGLDRDGELYVLTAAGDVLRLERGAGQ